MKSFQDIFDLWITQEAGFFVDVLIERGFLKPEDREHDTELLRAARMWRLTYVEDLELEDSTWEPWTVIAPETVVQDWYVGGFKGWQTYRNEGEDVATVGRVAEALLNKEACVPEQHLVGIPAFAQFTTDPTNSADTTFLLLRAGERIAILDGTHRSTALVYAAQTGLPVPEEIHTYVCDVSDKIFERFITDRPIMYGPYKKTAS